MKTFQTQLSLCFINLNSLSGKNFGFSSIKFAMYKYVFLKWILFAYGLSSTQQIWTVAELSFFHLNKKTCTHTWLMAPSTHLHKYLHIHTYTNTPLLCNAVMFPATREKVLQLSTLVHKFGCFNNLLQLLK